MHMQACMQYDEVIYPVMRSVQFLCCGRPCPLRIGYSYSRNHYQPCDE
ncbi:hypothetical protein GUJ93_ZPchr0009g852 [Zizania palustris]|uniref:Uncharacterized protein n=1 Tax=Zizania palustris TaxID=103762 RepID=A0A8J5VJ34_ZIZPA|nr:hypothetical protein GUJ93_ZPchr0009g852 [Zizania palustris]